MMILFAWVGPWLLHAALAGLSPVAGTVLLLLLCGLNHLYGLARPCVLRYD